LTEVSVGPDVCQPAGWAHENPAGASKTTTKIVRVSPCGASIVVHSTEAALG